MAEIYSFPPIIAADARVLILGSMPGEMSLTMQQYYAHRYNTFWKILGDLLGADPQLDYLSRIDLLKSHGIALWDVLMSCQRQGSLDSAIDAATMVPNDLAALYEGYPRIEHVFSTGRKRRRSTNVMYCLAWEKNTRIWNIHSCLLPVRPMRRSAISRNCWPGRKFWKTSLNCAERVRWTQRVRYAETC